MSSKYNTVAGHRSSVQLNLIKRKGDVKVNYNVVLMDRPYNAVVVQHKIHHTITKTGEDK